MEGTANRAIFMGIAFAVISAFMPAFVDVIKDILKNHTSNGDEQAATESISYIYAFAYVAFVGFSSYKGYSWEKSNNILLQRKSDELDAKLNKNSSDNRFIIKYLHTMPPQKYLAQFESTYVGLRTYHSEIEAICSTQYDEEKILGRSIAVCEEKIRSMNELLIRITKQWDTQGTVFDSTIEYRVNIMAFCNVDDAIEKFNSGEFDWKCSERFFMAMTPEGMKTDIDGVLLVDKELDVHFVGDKSEPIDSDRSPIALPVTFYGEQKSYHDQNLPGASKAFSTNETQYIECCKEAIHDEIKMMDHVSDFMKKELKEYYCEGNFAQSIISFPLHRAGEASFGVLNVYRNKSHLAKRNENDFMALMKPLIITISESMYQLYSLRLELNNLKETGEHQC
ncbi:hypothetical protein C0W88_02225 [Photobacterium leiognathi subsp. mandapamensis]|uniref:hypothetical protein n=2 Tax=Vibrionaceae TaxID=641 RepID=UPI000D176442|nr:hypothetical protein [Photobacterium leiognathi]MDF4321590.1 hypothetical protein [Vibrio parahaemolyticus]PSW67007.1 hypothetical protein C0W88_02225 [Photobacterium leiognathi subsp. mandapamensis]HAS6630723.1 hypothetical protein [Vibrio parahaemolyticus]